MVISYQIKVNKHDSVCLIIVNINKELKYTQVIMTFWQMAYNAYVCG